MQKCTYIPDALPVVSPQPYFVHEYRQKFDIHPSYSHNRFAILFGYFDCNGETHWGIHRGARTGEPVTFSRRSDAERLCSVLNSADVYAV